MAIIGDQLDATGEICGAVISKKYLALSINSDRVQFDTISIWNSHGDNETIRDAVRERIREVLGLPKDAEIEYKKHFGPEMAPGPQPSYKGGPPVKYVKKAPPPTFAPIYRSKASAAETAKTKEQGKPGENA